MRCVKRLSLCCLLLLVTCIVCSCSSGTGAEDTHEGQVKPPISSSSVSGKNYEDVVKQFESAGFKDVSTREVPDLITGWLTKEGDVDTVSINGDTEYSINEWYPQDASVVVAYHTYKNKKDKSTSTDAKQSKESSSNNKEDSKKEETNESNETSIPRIGIGDEFGNETISGVVTYADLDYKDYNDAWTTVESGQKVILIKIKLTNVSDKSNYVSVGDFDCYVDDVSTTSESFEPDYNANIEAGRSAILGAVYVIPENAKNIELEYNPFGERAERKIIVISDESTTETIIQAEESSGEKNVGSAEDVQVIGIGDEFGNKTITGCVQEVDLNWTGYNTAWTEIPEGKKAIYIKIKVTNISDEENYVSVGDFDCYVDDVIVDAEMVSGSDDDYNANIEAGRSAILGAMYVIPSDASSIELEYNPFGESAERVIIKIQ